MVDRLSSERRSALMARVRSKNTRPERLVRQLLHRLGYRFRLHQQGLPGKPDLVFGRRRKIILVHGCWWHRHSNCAKATAPKSNLGYWRPKFESILERDARVTHQLREDCWDVLVIWECEVRDTGALQTRLKNFLGPPAMGTRRVLRPKAQEAARYPAPAGTASLTRSSPR